MSCVNLFIVCIINVTTLLLSAHVHTCSCGTLLVDMSVQSDSIRAPSRHVQEGTTPLLRAAQEGQTGVPLILLLNGSSVQEQDNVG